MSQWPSTKLSIVKSRNNGLGDFALYHNTRNDSWFYDNAPGSMTVSDIKGQVTSTSTYCFYNSCAGQASLGWEVEAASRLGNGSRYHWVCWEAASGPSVRVETTPLP